MPQGRSGHVRNISPPTRIRSPDRPARSSVAIPTTLTGPQKHVTANNSRHESILESTHQLLFYADYVNRLGGGVGAVKENAGALVVASKEMDLK